MNSRRRRDKARGCARKRKYDTEAEALVEAVACVSKGAPKLRVYRCGFCSGWHLTKRPKNARVRA